MLCVCVCVCVCVCLSSSFNLSLSVMPVANDSADGVLTIAAKSVLRKFLLSCWLNINRPHVRMSLCVGEREEI